MQKQLKGKTILPNSSACTNSDANINILKSINSMGTKLKFHEVTFKNKMACSQWCSIYNPKINIIILSLIDHDLIKNIYTFLSIQFTKPNTNNSVPVSWLVSRISRLIFLIVGLGFDLRSSSSLSSSSSESFSFPWIII